MVFALRTFSTPIAIAAVRCDTLVPLDAAHHLGERAIQHMVELAHHFALVPEELLKILHPFEVADHHAAGVA